MSTRIEPQRYYSVADKATIEHLYNDGFDDAKIGALLDRSAKSISAFRHNNGITWRQADDEGDEADAAPENAPKSLARRCAQHLADLAGAHTHGYPSLRAGEGRFMRPLASFASHAGLMGSPAGLCADDGSPGRSGRVGVRGHQ